MKEIIVCSTVEPYVGKIQGIKLEAIPSTANIKLVGLLQSGTVTLGAYSAEDATKVFEKCTGLIMNPTINPVFLTFSAKPKEEDNASQNNQ